MCELLSRELWPPRAPAQAGRRPAGREPGSGEAGYGLRSQRVSKSSVSIYGFGWIRKIDKMVYVFSMGFLFLNPFFF